MSIFNYLAKSDFSSSQLVYSFYTRRSTSTSDLFFKAVELMGNGFITLSLNLAFIFVLKSKRIIKLIANIFILQLVDLFVNGAVKLAVRRPRPDYQLKSQPLMFPLVDHYAFPSGHASRVFSITAFLAPHVSLLSLIICLVVSLLVCLSRVFLARHTLGDVSCGALLGCFQGLLLAYYL